MKKTIIEQINILNELFPDIKFVNIDKDQDQEGYVIPHFKLFGSYNDAVNAVLNKIKETRPFYNWRENQISSEYLRQTKQKEKFWKDNADVSVIVLNAQLGEKFSKSVKDVRKSFDKNEIGLGAYEVGIILLTHPDTLKSYDDLWLDCPGDEYSPVADGQFSDAPLFRFLDDGVRFGTVQVSLASRHYGSAVGFLPQYRASKLGSLEPVEDLTLESAVKIVKKAGYKVIKEF